MSGLAPHSCKDPIFILGITPRSGTNFLGALLRLHPDCGSPRHPFQEDYLTHNSASLAKYVKEVYNNLSHQGQRIIDSEIKSILLKSIGNGLVNYLSSRIENNKRLLTKTPSVHNLKNFFDLFSDARLLIIVRDGRSVVESSVKSFGWSYRYAMRSWVYGAENIIRFQQRNKAKACAPKYLIVRYEDLIDNLESEIEKILLFLNLEIETYNFEAAQQLPVFGSSVLPKKEDKVSWKPVEKPQDFDSIQRWSNWDRKLHERFNWIAGEYMKAFGYELQVYENNQFIWDKINQVVDLLGSMKRRLEN